MTTESTTAVRCFVDVDTDQPMSPTQKLHMLAAMATYWEENEGHYPLSELEDVRQMRQCLDVMERRAVAEMRVRGESWQDIGDHFGITRQAAQQRFGRD